MINIERLPSIGSDHFPVLTTLQYEPEKTSQQQQNAPTLEVGDIKETEKKIAEGKKEGRKVSKERAAD